MSQDNTISGTLLKDKYRVMESLAEDITGTIYLVKDTKTEDEYILKEINDTVDKSVQETVLSEFTTTVNRAEGIEKKDGAPKVVDFFLQDSKCFMVIEYKKKTLKRLRAFGSLGRTLGGRYIVIKGIAAGGFGVVYLVKDATLKDKYWAMKEMYEQGGDPEIIERSFREEANLLAKLDHPNIPSISHFFTSNKRHYLVMEYIKGETLKEKLKKLSPEEYFSEEEVLEWGITVCDVLDYIHNLPRPIVFRDLKPDNIMINDKGELKLIDFGIARVFEGSGKTTIHALLTKGYAPPEQWMGKAEPRSDIYSLGVTLDYLLTKVHPEEQFPNFTPPHELNPGVSPELSKVILKAVQIKIENRYSTIKEMKEELEAIKLQKKIKEIRKLAQEYENKGEYLEASFQYKKVLEYNPDDEDTIYSLSLCYEKIGLKNEAIKNLNRILEISKDSIMINKARETINGLSEISLEDEEKTISATPPVISINPVSPRVGEVAWVDIKVREDALSSIEGNTLISSTRPDDDEISQPVSFFEHKGLLRGSITSSYPGETFITVVDKNSGNILTEKLSINFIPALPDPVKSKVTLAGDAMIEADGNESAIINITLVDKFENPLCGSSVKLRSHRKEGLDTFEEPPPTDTEGKTRGEVSSSNAGSAVITVIAEGVELQEKVEIKFAVTSTQVYSLEKHGEIKEKEVILGKKKPSALIPVLSVFFIILILIAGFFIYRHTQKVKIDNYMKKGNDYFSQKNYEAALAEYQNALKVDPDLFLALKSSGDIYFIKKDFDKALLQYQRALSVSPDNLEILKNMSDILYNQKEYERILEHLENIIKLNPHDKNTLNKLSFTYFSLKQYDKSLEVYKKLSGDPLLDTSSLIKLGNIYLSGKDYSKAEECFNLILSKEKNNLDAHRALSKTYQEKGDYEKSIDENKIILSLASSDVFSHVSMGTSFYKLKDYKSALEWFTKAMKLKLDNSQKEDISSLSFDCYINLGDENLKAGKYKEAESKFASASKIFPDRKEFKEGFAKSYLGEVEILMKQKDYTPAEELCHKVLSLFSEGEFSDKAREYLKKIDESRPVYVKPTPDYYMPDIPIKPPPDIIDGGGIIDPDIM